MLEDFVSREAIRTKKGTTILTENCRSFLVRETGLEPVYNRHKTTINTRGFDFRVQIRVQNSAFYPQKQLQRRHQLSAPLLERLL